MKIVLDECLPHDMVKMIADHQVTTVQALGWSGVKNGKLLKLIEGNQSDLFITADRNLPYQQNLEGFRVAIIALKLFSLRIGDIKPLMPKLQHVIESIKPGEFLVVGE